MTTGGFEPAIPAIKRLQTYALESTATGIGRCGTVHVKCFKTSLNYDKVMNEVDFTDFKADVSTTKVPRDTAHVL